jgi:cellulose synthase/poly-beta-1,6-N-acetylglucosamine synthase-like glycosyltransferase
MSAPSVTVVVPVKDRRERMLRCLDALLALDYPHYDVLVLDNCSSDGTAQACRDRADGASVDVRVKVMDGSVGALRNRAAEIASGELLAYTDSDCAPAPDWLVEGVKPFSNPEVGVVQGRTEPEPRMEMRPWAASIEVREYTKRFESCNLLVRREPFAAVDGFDEVVGHFWEDTAAGWSMLREGWKPAYAPAALVHHDVTYPDFRWWLKRGLRYGNASRVVGNYPELRSEVLWGRFFLRRRNAAAAAAALGLLLGRLDRRALVLAIPYAWERRPPDAHPWTLAVGMWMPVAFDASILVGMVRGSLRHRHVVL